MGLTRYVFRRTLLIVTLSALFFSCSKASSQNGLSQAKSFQSAARSSDTADPKKITTTDISALKAEGLINESDETVLTNLN